MRTNSLGVLASAFVLAMAMPVAAEEAGTPDTDAAGECGATYTVSEGETLSAIATRCARSVDALLKANSHLSDPARISIGQELAVPALPDLPETAEAEDAQIAEENVAEPSSRHYTVEPGDSMASIASRLGLRLPDLLEVNEGVNPRALQPGQELVLPETAAKAARPGGAENGLDGTGDAPADGSQMAAAPADKNVDAPGPEDSVSAEAEAVPERLALEGRIRKGSECPVLRTPDGQSYALVSQSYGFTPGDYVTIEGELIDMTLCTERTTIRVTSMKTRRAPGGG